MHNKERAIELIEQHMRTLNVPYYFVNVSKDNQDILSFGEYNGKRATGNERLFMFSMTKPITTFLIMQLIEQGKLSLDDKASDYLPFVKDCFIVENGRKKVVGHKILIRHLLTMTAGFNYNLGTSTLKALLEQNKDADTIEVLKAICLEPLSFDVGKKFNYSLCHDFLAGIIEVKTKERFGDYAKKALFSPLDMKESGFLLKDIKDLSVFADRYYYNNGQFLKTELTNDLAPFSNYESGGAGLISTINDYFKFAKMLANYGEINGKIFVEKSTIDLWKTAQEQFGNQCSEFTCAQGDDYSYGLGIRTRIKQTFLPIGEFGWDGAEGSYLMIDNINKVSIVIGMHNRGWPAFIRHLDIVKIIYQNLI